MKHTYDKITNEISSPDKLKENETNGIDKNSK